MIGYLLQSCVRDAVTWNAEVSEPVVDLMEELHKRSVFGRLVRQNESDLVTEIFNQSGCRNVLENHIGDQGDVWNTERVDKTFKMCVWLELCSKTSGFGTARGWVNNHFWMNYPFKSLLV